MLAVVPLTDKSYEDAKAVVMSRFPAEALSVLDQTMQNPLRASCSEIGDIVYEDDRPVAFRAANRRRLHFKNVPIFGRVRGLTCRVHNAPKGVMDLLQDEQAKRVRGCSLAFSNTQCIPTERMALKRGAFPGPESCTRFLWRPIRPIECVMYGIKRKILNKEIAKQQQIHISAKERYDINLGSVAINRICSANDKFFDKLMSLYLITNRGLVSDRWAQEIEWLFGKRINEGRCVILGASEADRPVGYIAMKTDSYAKRWLIVDWFAVDNDLGYLEKLLIAGCSFLKTKTPAIMVETIGFPTYVQGLLKKYLPFVRRCDANWCSYNFIELQFQKECQEGLNSKNSWFFGPLDGDMCMGA